MSAVSPEPATEHVRGFEATLARPMDEVEAAVRAALGEEGFGVLTEIDVAATLRAKLGEERPPLKILGACNPQLAHTALELDPSVAMLLPCNVVLEEPSPGTTRVRIVDPRELMAAPAFADLARRAAESFARVLSRLAL
jgi:uncharacterized protein (DUF302 family)